MKREKVQANRESHYQNQTESELIDKGKKTVTLGKGKQEDSRAKPQTNPTQLLSV